MNKILTNLSARAHVLYSDLSVLSINPIVSYLLTMAAMDDGAPVVGRYQSNIAVVQGQTQSQRTYTAPIRRLLQDASPWTTLLMVVSLGSQLERVLGATFPAYGPPPPGPGA